MGQSSISILNKVGYSMYWNSMWDNKIMYNRYLKEDIFLDKYFNLIFNDNVSLNVFNLKKINIIKNDHFLNQNINDTKTLNKYLLSLNNTIHFSSKIWVLKYQKWLILYNFVFLSKNNKQFIRNILSNTNDYKSNFFYIYKYYLKINKNLANNFSFYKHKISFNSF